MTNHGDYLDWWLPLNRVRNKLMVEEIERVGVMDRELEIAGENSNQDSTPESMSGVFERLEPGEKIEVYKDPLGGFVVAATKRVKGHGLFNRRGHITEDRYKDAKINPLVHLAWMYLKNVRGMIEEYHQDSSKS